MSNRTVDAQKKILLLLSGSQMSVNALQKQTSSDKYFFEQVLKSLKKGQLTEEHKDKKHKQKKNQTLTEFGKELAYTLNLTYDFRILNEKLESPINSICEVEKFAPAARKQILLSKGWSAEEAQQWIKYCVDSKRLQYSIQKSFNELVLYRYSDILQRFTINKHGQKILYDIIVSILHNHVQNVIGYLSGMKSYVLPFYNLRADLKDEIDRWNNRFISAEILEYQTLVNKFIKAKFIDSDATEKLKIVKDRLLGNIQDDRFQEEMKGLDMIYESAAKKLGVDKKSLIEAIINETSIESK